MTAEEDRKPSDDAPIGKPAADPDSELFDEEGDVDEDRQDAPRADKVGDDEPELDGFKATPGDGAEDR